MLLRSVGVSDFSKYKVDPSISDEELAPDFFVDWCGVINKPMVIALDVFIAWNALTLNVCLSASHSWKHFLLSKFVAPIYTSLWCHRPLFSRRPYFWFRHVHARCVTLIFCAASAWFSFSAYLRAFYFSVASFDALIIFRLRCNAFLHPCLNCLHWMNDSNMSNCETLGTVTDRNWYWRWILKCLTTKERKNINF